MTRPLLLGATLGFAMILLAATATAMPDAPVDVDVSPSGLTGQAEVAAQGETADLILLPNGAAQPPMTAKSSWASSARVTPQSVGGGLATPIDPMAATALGLGALIVAWPAVRYGSVAFLGLFSRIPTDRLLVQAVRGRVYAAICENPGLSMRELQRVVGIGWGTLAYHVDRLERERLVMSQRHRQFRRFYKNGSGIAADDRTAIAELTNETTRRLASLLLARPGSIQRDLSNELRISAPLAHKFLTRLESAHLVTRERAKRTVKYFPTPHLGSLLQPASVSAEPAPGAGVIAA